MNKVITLFLLVFLLASCDRNEKLEEFDFSLNEMYSGFLYDLHNQFVVIPSGYDNSDHVPQRPGTQAVHRYYHPNTRVHYYTFEGPYDPFNVKGKNYTYETREYYAYPNSISHYPLRMIERYYSSAGKHCLLPKFGYTFDGYLGYIFLSPQVGTSPLKEYYSVYGDSYHYTSSIAEDRYIMENTLNTVIYQQTIGWVYTARNDINNIPDTRVTFAPTPEPIYFPVQITLHAKLLVHVEEKQPNGTFVKHLLSYPFSVSKNTSATITIPKKYFVMAATIKSLDDMDEVDWGSDYDIFSPINKLLNIPGDSILYPLLPGRILFGKREIINGYNITFKLSVNAVP